VVINPVLILASALRWWVVEIRGLTREDRGKGLCGSKRDDARRERGEEALRTCVAYPNELRRECGEERQAEKDEFHG